MSTGRPAQGQTGGGDPSGEKTGEQSTENSNEPALAVAAVARRLGVAPATLRTWDRRYGLGPSAHSAGAHRRYSSDDVARLMVMRRLALEGVAPVDAARAALAVDLTTTSREQLEDELRETIAHADEENQRHGRRVDPDQPHAAPEQPRRLVGLDREAHDDRGAVVEPATEALSPASPNPASPNPTSSTPALSGPRSLRDVSASAPGDPEPQRPSLRLAAPVDSEVTSIDVIDAVLRGNVAATERLLALDADQDPAQWWMTLVEPTLRKLAARTVLAKPGEAPESLLASATLKVVADFIRAREEQTALETGVRSPHPSQMKKIVLLFAAADDAQPLAMHALAAALVAQGVTARIVTGPANAHRALELVTMVRPVATVLVTSLSRPELGIVHALHETHPELSVFVGLSSDDAAADLPQSRFVSRVRSFQGLLHEVLAVAV
ncbi:predicted transcriptional regulator [Sanguibacter keddieii DSM 10542]|uniref:Predicted transcriptional regulator n=1 Tax=Sanguibacter keddieii (strain ATCC 51767 / DSM 10542 / NCFB 3025 / ST-74) TaxID=446469 RepID=D1BBJ9_SANKS|nr:MerR family transcriptional regulator [Sanguibacter keddieii]ACZ22770.1 predicted transcriptional regulator [Sanguibacter keddieii DSM 10542]